MRVCNVNGLFLGVSVHYLRLVLSRGMEEEKEEEEEREDLLQNTGRSS